MSHTGLDDIFRPQVTNQTPYCTDQSRVTIIPRAKTLRPRSNPVFLEFCQHFGPQNPKLRSELAGPRETETRMNPLLPVIVGFVWTLRSALLTLSGINIPDLDPCFKRVCHQIKGGKRIL